MTPQEPIPGVSRETVQAAIDREASWNSIRREAAEFDLVSRGLFQIPQISVPHSGPAWAASAPDCSLGPPLTRTQRMALWWARTRDRFWAARVAFRDPDRVI